MIKCWFALCRHPELKQYRPDETLDEDPRFFDDVPDNKVEVIHGTEKTQVYWQNSYVTVSETDNAGKERKSV